MKQWAVAVLMTKRLKDGGLEIRVVPVFVHADDKRATMDLAEQSVADIKTHEYRGCSFVEAAEGEAVHSEGVSWSIGAFVSMRP